MERHTSTWSLGVSASECRLREHLREKRHSCCLWSPTPSSQADVPTGKSRHARGLSSHDMAVFKGDANDRRLLGERAWVARYAMEVEVVGYFSEAVHTLALRTLKFPLAAGLSPSSITAARAAFGDRWDCTGQCDVIQFAARNRE